AKHVPLNYWSSSWIPGINAARPNTFTLAEAWLEGDSTQLKPYLDAGFDSTFNFPLRKALVDSIGKAGSLDILAAKVQDYTTNLGINRALLQVNFLDNHDVQRFINEPGFGVAESEIRKRYHMGLGALFTLPGIPQLYYGDELGVYGGGDPDNRKDMPSWAWTDAGRNATQSGYLAGGGNPKTTFDFVQKLTYIRGNNEALWKGGYVELWRPNGGATNVFAFYRGNNLNNRFVVVFNNGSAASGNVTINISGNTFLPATDRSYMASATYDDQAGQGAPATITASGGNLVVNLPAKTFAIYKAR
ncbi:alpha-amylase family glycosyl hydrolase, partial [Deinococcus roseus]|uniref:alpha-amylase family glycosyl hydrolase n=1 Tax=Deinococcus roseus TaxID=392414 RepID=UPI00227BAE5A